MPDFRGLAAVVVWFVAVATTAVAGPVGDGGAPWVLNPTGLLGWTSYAAFYVLSILAKEVLDRLLKFLLCSIMHVPRMDGEGHSVNKLEVLENVDCCYLALCTVVEFVGMNHIAALLLSDHVTTGLENLSVGNGPVAMVALMLLNDALYYPFHVVAHWRSLYPYNHKHHHRQSVPFRGYFDAANEHPIEQTYGFGIFLASAFICSRTVGLHVGACFAAFVWWGLFNIMNHGAFDSRFHLPVPYPCLPRDHQMHHRYPQCNYTTLSSCCDRAFGTFRPYVPIGGRQPPAPTRPEALPSPWAVLAAGGFVLAAAVLHDFVVRGGSATSASSFALLARPAAAVALATGACAAAAALWGAAETAPRKKVS